MPLSFGVATGSPAAANTTGIAVAAFAASIGRGPELTRSAAFRPGTPLSLPARLNDPSRQIASRPLAPRPPSAATKRRLGLFSATLCLPGGCAVVGMPVSDADHGPRLQPPHSFTVPPAPVR